MTVTTTNAKLLGAVGMFVLCAATTAHAGTTFVSTLSGEHERPISNHSPANATATAELSGTKDKYVLTYTIKYEDLTGIPEGGDIHFAVIPPGMDPNEQTGPIVEEMDDFPNPHRTKSGTISADWRFDDKSKPLTNSLVDSLFDGELYFNIRTDDFPTGEIRGQIVAGSSTPIPLPASVWTGLIGMGAVGLGVTRFGRARRA